MMDKVRIPVKKTVIEYKESTTCYDCMNREHIGFPSEDEMFCKHMKARKRWRADFGIPDCLTK